MQNSTEPKVINGVTMVSSRVISDVTGKKHQSIVRDIKIMLKQLDLSHNSDLNDGNEKTEYGDFKGFIINSKEYCGRIVTDEIWLSEILFLNLVMGYGTNLRMAIIRNKNILEPGKVFERVSNILRQFKGN